MSTINKILLVMEADDKQLPALNRALELRESQQAELKVIVISFDHGYDISKIVGLETPETIRSRKMERDQDWINEHIQGEKIQVDLTWNKHIYHAALAVAAEFAPDIIVKPVGTHSSSRLLSLRASDWQLIKDSPAAVLLVHPESTAEYTNILATADLSHGHQGHRVLNRVINKYSRILADQDNEKLSLATAIPRIDPQLLVAIQSTSAVGIVKKIEEEYTKDAKAFCNVNNIKVSRLHIGVGEPSDVVNQIAKDTEANVVVVGTLARSGVEGLFMGNTAEKILHHMECDVLCVKPGDYISHSEFEEELEKKNY